MLFLPTSLSTTEKLIPLTMHPLHIIVYDSGKISNLSLVLLDLKDGTIAAMLDDLPRTTVMVVDSLQNEDDDGCDPPQTETTATLVVDLPQTATMVFDTVINDGDDGC
ncbi:unnamed protein product [Lactuca virosa]|uniref:Cleavage/polyadenylation specificity factor A subunit N-terminal domain-containing protein n=1 Tax=Lactuca virosa TaxID=75947 RepID=A0AAU9NXC8_9ASTR|nr:unnamed protein product [Lactuca virosa]